MEWKCVLMSESAEPYDAFKYLSNSWIVRFQSTSSFAVKFNSERSNDSDTSGYTNGVEYPIKVREFRYASYIWGV